MTARGRILILAAAALAAVPCAAWSAQPAVGRDYYSVQLMSGKTAAGLQKSLASLAGQPYARIDKRGDTYILRVGFWESREEAEQAAQALLANFRKAYARVASYRPDAIVASAGGELSAAASRSGAAATPTRTVEARAEPRSRTAASSARAAEIAAEPPAAAGAPATTAPRTPEVSDPSRGQAQVLGVRRDAQSNLVPDPDLQAVYPLPPPPPEVAPPVVAQVAPPPREVAPEPVEPRPRRERARPSPPRGPNEQPLWDMLSAQRYADIDAELIRLRKAYPLWKPPARLLALKRDAEVRLRIAEAAETKDWKNVLAFSRQYPGQFSCDNLEYLLALAEAYYSQNDPANTLAVVERIIPGCPNAVDRINTLQRVNALFTLEVMQHLLQRELQGGRRDADQQARFDRLVFDFQLRGLQEALQAKDRARTLSIIETADRMPASQRNARYSNQIGWVYLEFEQDEEAIRRFETALSGKPEAELAQDIYQGLALANYRLSQREDPESVRLRVSRIDAAEAALARTDPADTRTRDLLGLIFLTRAGDAFESKEYGQSLAYLDQAEALGRSGRDVVMRRAWLYYQMGDDKRASESFANLYREQPDKDIAEALAFSLSRSGRWNELARLSQSLGGPLVIVGENAGSQRYFDSKMYLAAEFAVPGNYAELDNIASSSVGLGAMMRYKPGSDGTSQLTMLRVPVVEATKVIGGVNELRLQMDVLDMSARDLAAGAMIGSFPAAGVYVVTPTTRFTGVEPYLSFRHQGSLNAYGGVGFTPTNGVITSAPIWNLGLSGQLASANVGAELFSQPVRETILSYTGIVDPYTGQSWGRVLRTGGLLRGYVASDSWSVSSMVQAVNLTGVNVANNQAVKLNLGLAKNLSLPKSSWLPALDYLTVGPNLAYESYRKNLGQFTIGHGGYYSPQRVFTYGGSAQFLTREARQYSLKGDVSLGKFRTNSDASPCFPLGGAALPLNPACVTGYTASSGTGYTYSAQAIGVRRLSDHLQLGGGMIWRRSPSYDDKLGMVFVRYLFDPRPAVMSTDIPDAAFQRLY